MNAVHQFIDLFRDSPTYGRDRANLISGVSIGMAGLLLNAAVLMLVLPLMLDPDDRDFRLITENVEFGQLLALILLGGATAFATLLIPLRLATVFMGPRIGRYFDQVVLSGISPLRFVIGKATSQNLFLGLILFLLLPYLVLSLTLGGVDPAIFLAGLFLVWLYCMALALVTLWVSLYLNELLAAVLVTKFAFVLSVLGCIPMTIQPFVLTPFPVLMNPVYSSIPFTRDMVAGQFFPVFMSSAVSLIVVIAVSLFAIYLGPLYGIIRENSTFGEVVRAGDTKKKRWFRLRLHIQRPSEIAFFYENRGNAFRSSEGLLRWGLAMFGLLLLSCGSYFLFAYLMATVLASAGGQSQRWWVYEFHMIYPVIHGCGLVIAMFLFSHAKNSTFVRLPFVRGWRVEVARLDTVAFLLFLLISTAAAISTPMLFEQFVAAPAGETVFPSPTPGSRLPVDYGRLAVEGSLVISVAALTIYAFHRLVCLMTWLRSVSLIGIAGLYFILVCMFPVFIGAVFVEVRELRSIPLFEDWAPRLAMASPATVLMHLFNEMGSQFPKDVTSIPFYVLHSVLFALTMFAIRRRGRSLRRMYRVESVGGNSP